MKKSNIIGVVILMLGVVFGVILVQQSQEYRERAASRVGKTVTICYKDEATGEWGQINIEENQLRMFLDKGAMVGTCIEGSIPTVIPTTNFDSYPTTTNTGSSGQVKLDFKIRFQSINSRAPNKRVNIEVVATSGGKQVFNNVVVSSDAQGVYGGTVTGMGAGTYDVFIKGTEHLQRRFANVRIVRGGAVVDWTGDELIVGDFNLDNNITSADVALMMSSYTESTTEVNDVNRRFDINADGIIDMEDVNIVITNYNQLEVSGEN